MTEALIAALALLLLLGALLLGHYPGCDAIVRLSERKKKGFDLVLLDVDNGPDFLVFQGNAGIYESAFLQRVRDEAHRFAITGHRKRRARRHNESVLETVPGLGPAKRRALLRHFGGMQGLLRAGVTDFEAVSGIGTTLARTLYDHLHPGA